MQFKNFLETCQNFGHKYLFANFFGNEPIDDYKFWHAMALAMQELKANQLGPWILCYFGPSGWDFFSNQGEGTEDIYRYQFAVLCYLLQPREGYC
jgi:hypothetical protein